jgi:hypothetical protein
MMKMKRTHRWIASPIALALGAMLIVAAPASAEDDKDTDDKDRRERQAERQADREQARQERREDRTRPRQLQAFDLEHRSPQQMQQLLSLRSQSAIGQPGQAVAGRTTNPQQRTAFRPQLDRQERMAFAVDNENNVLFVRGSRQQIKEVEDLVKALDVSADKLKKQTIGETQLIPIHKDSANQVRTTLSQLQLPNQLITIGEAAMVVIAHDGSDEQKAHAEQVEQVITKLEAAKGLGESSDKQESDKEKSDKDTSDSDPSADEADSDKNERSEDSSDESSAR